MSEIKEWRGYEITYPRIPKELQSTDPDNMAFLSVIGDFGLFGVTKNCLYIRAAILEAIKHPDFLDRLADEIFESVAETCSEDFSTVKNGMVYTLEILWERCDEKRLIKKYFPFEQGKKMPHHTDTVAFMEFIYEMVMQRYLYLRGTRG